MSPKTKKISESVTLHTLNTDKFKTGVLTLSVLMPKTRTSPAYNYLLSGILRRGTASYPSITSLNRRLDELYGSTIEIKSTKYGKNEAFVISAEILDNSFATDGEDIADGVLEVISELLFAPKSDADGIFTADDVRREKKIAADNLRAIINNPRAYASMRASELVHRDDADYMGLDATISAIEKVSREDMAKYFREQIQSRPIDIFYVGTLTEDELTEKINKHFGAHKATLCEPAVSATPTIKPREPISVGEEMPISQGKLILDLGTGVCLGSPDYYALVMLNEILGESPASKLFMNVREKLSLCYYCSSVYNMYTGTLRISSGIERDDKEKALSAILSELSDIKAGKISDTEFSAARKSLENIYKQIYDNPFELSAFYSARDIFSHPDTPESCRASLLSVTKDDVVRVAQKVCLDTEYFLYGNASEGGDDDYDE